MDGEEFFVIVEKTYQGMRIDKYLSVMEDTLSRSYIKRLIQEQFVSVNQKVAKANYVISEGDQITYFVPAPKDLTIEPEDIPIDIIYEDYDIIVINKAKGMVVHPAAGHYTNTLVNALLYHCKGSLSGINGILRPGIVHRIDMDTTGVLVVCKNDIAHQFIAEQLRVHSITRKYNALVYGTFTQANGRVEGTIGRHPYDRKKMAMNVKHGKPAVTNYQVLENINNKYSHIECSLETGRTHQIRVHMSAIHHPLLGDIVYGNSKNEFHLQGQALHARILGLIHPSTKKYMEFEADLPEYFIQLINKINKR